MGVDYEDNERKRMQRHFVGVIISRRGVSVDFEQAGLSGRYKVLAGIMQCCVDRVVFGRDMETEHREDVVLGGILHHCE